MSSRRRLRKRYPTERETAPDLEREAEPEPEPEALAIVPAPPVVTPAPVPPANAAPEAQLEPPLQPVDESPAMPLTPEHESRPVIEAAPELEPAPVGREWTPGWALADPVREPVAEPEVAPVGADGMPRMRRRHRFAGLLLGFILPILAFATGLALFNGFFMPRLIHGVGEVKVPDLANLNLDQAEQALTAANLQLSRAGERFDPAVPAGFVLSQDPPPGSAVRGRRRVSVVVSLGEEYSSVPELFGESERGALVLLKNSGLRAGGFTRAPSDEVGEGLVVATDPPGAAVLTHDTPIALLISTGQGEESFVMPDLLGREIGGVRRQLEALGFRVLTPPAAPSIGSIVSQNPAPGSRITRDTPIVVHATGRMIR